MSELGSFTTGIHAAVIGASGGIGSALVNALQSSNKVDQIHAFSRQPHDQQHKKILHYNLDICDESQVQQAAKTITQPLHLIIVATGILHSETIAPEKSLTDISYETMQHVFAINTLGPTLIAKHFLPVLDTTKKSLFAVLSARVGSISDNRLGGWYSYRSSKAALNMLIKNMAIETKRKNKQAIIAALHPGTVNTPLSRPFQRNVSPEKLFSAADSAAHLLTVMDTLTPENTGKIFAWDGKEIPA